MTSNLTLQQQLMFQVNDLMKVLGDNEVNHKRISVRIAITNTKGEELELFESIVEDDAVKHPIYFD